MMQLPSVLSFLAGLAVGMTAFATHPMLNPSGLDIPRFVSLKSGKVNMRRGPGKDFPIQWVYERRFFPVEVIEEFGHWRKIRDREGQEGWVHFRLLSGERFAITQTANDALIPAFADSDPMSPLRLEAEPGALVRLLQCRVDWCEIHAGDYTGWMEKQHLWGVYPDERFSE